MTATDEQRELLRLDYDQTTGLLRTLTDVRFKLLAFVPTISGVAVGLLGRGPSAAELLAVGSLGLVATLGIVLYELHNSQAYEYALARAAELEVRLGLRSPFHRAQPGGLFRERLSGTWRFFGLASGGHERGLAVVYSAAVGGWSYLVAWGALHALTVASARQIGGAIGGVAGLLVLIMLLRLSRVRVPATESNPSTNAP